jgi:phage gpG-like protein
MRELARVAPVELDAALVRVGEETIVPASKSRAQAAFSGAPPHDGTSVRLADQTKMVPTPKGAAIVNDKVYANVQNWGGRTHGAISRVGRSAMPKGSGVPATHFISDAARDNPAFTAAMERELAALVTKHLGF